MSAKQDRTYTRTASALEQKYKFGKSFAEVMGIANGARDEASEAKDLIDKLDNDLNSTEIFNRLTENGKLQGLYKEDGDLYINAKYIGNVEELFAKNITMTGKFTTTAEVFLEPGEPEIAYIRDYIVNLKTPTADDLRLYDFNGNGSLDIGDVVMANMARMGAYSLADKWSGAVKSNVTVTIDISNPRKAICIAGTNMWGRSIEVYFGTSSPFMDSDPQSAFNSFLTNSGLIEYGSFTPTLSGSVTYEKCTGEYYKIGKMVHINIDIELSSKGNTTSALIITGLPYKPSVRTALAESYDYATKTPQVALAEPENYIRLTHDSGGSWGTTTHAYITDTFHVIVSGCYLTDS